MNSITSYRQPMVTATGILLGFVLNFTAEWETNADSKHLIRDVIIGTGLILCIVILIAVLYRILNMNYPKHNEEAYYRKTLRLFIIGFSIPFTTLLVITVKKIFE